MNGRPELENEMTSHFPDPDEIDNRIIAVYRNLKFGLPFSYEVYYKRSIDGVLMNVLTVLPPDAALTDEQKLEEGMKVYKRLTGFKEYNLRKNHVFIIKNRNDDHKTLDEGGKEVLCVPLDTPLGTVYIVGEASRHLYIKLLQKYDLRFRCALNANYGENAIRYFANLNGHRRDLSEIDIPRTASPMTSPGPDGIDKRLIEVYKNLKFGLPSSYDSYYKRSIDGVLMNVLTVLPPDDALTDEQKLEEGMKVYKRLTGFKEHNLKKNHVFIIKNRNDEHKSLDENGMEVLCVPKDTPLGTVYILGSTSRYLYDKLLQKYDLRFRCPLNAEFGENAVRYFSNVDNKHHYTSSVTISHSSSTTTEIQSEASTPVVASSASSTALVMSQFAIAADEPIASVALIKQGNPESVIAEEKIALPGLEDAPTAEDLNLQRILEENRALEEAIARARQKEKRKRESTHSAQNDVTSDSNPHKRLK